MVDVKTQVERPVECAWKVTVQAVAGGNVGPFSEHLTITTTVPETAPVNVALTGTQGGAYEFFPTSGTRYSPAAMLIHGGTVEAAKGQKYKLLIIPRGLEGPLEAESIETTPAWIKASLVPASDDPEKPRYFLEVEIPPNSPKVARVGETPAMIYLKTNHPTAPGLRFGFTFLTE